MIGETSVVMRIGEQSRPLLAKVPPSHGLSRHGPCRTQRFRVAVEASSQLDDWFGGGQGAILQIRMSRLESATRDIILQPTEPQIIRSTKIPS